MAYFGTGFYFLDGLGSQGSNETFFNLLKYSIFEIFMDKTYSKVEFDPYKKFD